MALLNLQKNGMAASGSMKDKKVYVPDWMKREDISFTEPGLTMVNGLSSRSVHNLYLPHTINIVKVKGNFAMHDLLLQLLELVKLDNGKVPDVWITSFSMTPFSANVIGALKVDGKIDKLSILMDKESKTRYPQVDQILKNICNDYAFTQIHAKVLVVSNGFHSFTVIGSANWTKNPRIESLVILKGNLYAFKNIDWITEEIKLAYDRE